MESRSVQETEESPKNAKAVSDLEHKESEGAAISRARKSGSPKGGGHSIFSSVSKIVSHIKKPSLRRSGSPVNWFPRKKGDTYLKRKIKLLQQTEGMNLSLDETLGKANPHYTKIAREKIAAREAAQKAMTARKNAMVEASWCRVLKAARIQSKEAEAELEKAQKSATEAFEAARAKGVTMYDKPDTSRKLCEVESHSSEGGVSTHTVTASFETAFEVDKEVMAAIKKAFIYYANCPDSSNKEELNDLLKKISQTPEYTESDLDSSDVSSELVNAMLERLKNLQETDLSSLATVVATSGLNAALLKLEHGGKDREHRAMTARRISSANRFIDGCLSRRDSNAELPSLDKFLVKHLSKLEKEVLEARRSSASNRKSDFEVKSKSDSGEPTSDLGSILVKHVSKLEKEVQEAKRLQNSKNPKFSKNEVSTCKENVDGNIQQTPLKHMTRLQRAKVDELNSPSLDKILVKFVHRLEKEKMEASGKDYGVSAVKRRNMQFENVESLDNVLVKHQSKLEKEKIAARKEPVTYRNTRDRKCETIEFGNSDSLDKILMKHKPEIEKAKNVNAEDYVKHAANARKEARERELQEAWGGLSLGNSIKPHVSRLERDKAAWKKAEEEERSAKQAL